MTKISTVIIARNEEANLPRCLTSVAWTDEIVLVDSGSTDRTVKIAREFGAIIVTTEWKGFGHSKQSGLDKATGDWVFSIDADEEISPALATEIQKVTASSGAADGYQVPRLTSFLGRWIRHGGWYPDYVLRLFRRERGNFTTHTVHESVEVDGSTRNLSNHLLHHCYPNLEQYFEKMNRYTTLAADELYRKGRTAGLTRLTCNPVAKFIKQYVLRAGFLDGVEGFMLAVLSAGYVFTKYSKLRDLNRRGGGLV